MHSTPPTRLTADTCPHFGPCGGCSWLGEAYDLQLERKRRAVAEALAVHSELAGVSPRAVVPAPHPHHYRNRLLYPLARRGGRVVGGFFRRGTHDLVDVHACSIQDPAITEIANRLRDAIAKSGAPIRPLPGIESDPAPARPGAAIRALAVRVASGTGEVMVGFVTTGGLFPEGRALADAAVEAGAGLVAATGRDVRVVSVVRNLNDAETNVVLGERSVPLLGRDHVDDRLAGLRLRVSLGSFFQPNAAAARLAAADLAEGAGDTAGLVVDAYAGVGVLALLLARRAREVVAIEESRSAAADAVENVRSNGAANVSIERGSVAERLPAVAARGAIALLVLDPPRAGLEPPALDAAIAARPDRIAYLSCAPGSLARDLAALVRAGWVVDDVTPRDFLPQTDHVEALARLKRAPERGRIVEHAARGPAPQDG